MSCSTSHLDALYCPENIFQFVILQDEKEVIHNNEMCHIVNALHIIYIVPIGA